MNWQATLASQLKLIKVLLQPHLKKKNTDKS